MALFKRIEGILDRRRFWSLPRRKRMTWLSGQPHLDVDQWLATLQLSQYLHCFQNARGVEELLDLDEADIKSLGVKNGADRAKIVSSLVYLQNKYEKAVGYCSIDRSGIARDKCCQVLEKSPERLFTCASKDSGNASSLKGRMEPVIDCNASPRQLRKALEWELSLDSRDLRSHAWYHGSIPRVRAEELILQDGDFLIRDCISQPGDYVLTCRFKGSSLHFVINKMIIQPNTVYERIQYLLEDDTYDTVPDLVTCYVGSGKPISSASMAKISHPINRSMPLSFYASRYGSYCRSESDQGSRTVSPMPSFGSGDSSKTSPVQSPKGTPPGSPSLKRAAFHQLMPTPASEKHRSRSVKGDYGRDCAPGAMAVSLNSADDGGCGDSVRDGRHMAAVTLSRRQQLIRAGSEPMLSPRLERKNACGGLPTAVVFDSPLGDANMREAKQLADSNVPPPKPSRTPSVKSCRRPYVGLNHLRDPQLVAQYPPASPGLALVEHLNLNCGSFNNESDSGNGSGDSIHSGDALFTSMTLGSVKRRPVGGQDRRRRPCSDTRYSFLDRKSGASTDGGGSEADSAIGEEPTLAIPNLDPPSYFDLGPNSTVASIVSLLLPGPENKPLELTALRKVHSVLVECGSRVLAAHLTRVDLDVLRMSADVDLGLGVTTGLELLTLPQGRQLRLDLIERTECLKLFVSVTILTCRNETERASLLRKWIEIAIDTKTSLGNLFSFVGIMLGLGIPQVQRLKLSWLALRQSCTDIAFTYEAKLRPMLKAMNECNNPQAPNTTIPHLLPLIMVIEKTFVEFAAVHDDEGVDGELKNFNLLCQSPMTTTTASPQQPQIRCSFPWEQSSTDYGTHLLFTHLECGRNYVQQSNIYRRNSEIVLENVKYEELLLAMFRTEFHLKFLWGNKGASVGCNDRHVKFEQIITAMSERCEPS